MNDLAFPATPARKGVLLLHGLTGVPAEMRLIGRKLDKAGFEVASPMLAGHGAGKAALLRTGWGDWLASARRAYLELAARVDDVFVAGVCVGGALGLALCAEFPSIRRAAVYSMAFEYDGWNMPKWASAAPLIQLVAALPLIRRIDFEEPYPYGLKDLRLRELVSRSPESLIPGSISRMPLGALYEMYRLGRYVERIGPRVGAPTLIVHADEDDMSHPRNADRLAAALGGPTERLRLDGSYHMVHLDRQHALVADATIRFFATPPADLAVRVENQSVPALQAGGRRE